MQSNNVISEKINENKQKDFFTEIYLIPNPDDEKVCERKWTMLHDQAMDSFPIKTPVKAILFFVKFLKI